MVAGNDSDSPDAFVPDSPPEQQVSNTGELAAAREMAGLSQQEVAQTLRIDVHQIASIEAGNFEPLPGPAFARGVIRSMGRLLNVDTTALVATVGLSPAGANGVVSSLDELSPIPARPVASAGAIRGIRGHSGGDGGRWRSVWLSAAAVFVVGLMLFAGLTGPVSRDQQANSTVVQVPVPGFKPVAAAAPGIVKTQISVGSGQRPAIRPKPGLTQTVAVQNAPVMPLDPVFKPGFTDKKPAAQYKPPVRTSESESVQLSFSKATWVEIRHKNGEKLLFGTQKAAKSLTIRGVPPMQVVIGNPDGVKMRFRGESVDLHAKARKGVSRFILN